MAEVDELVGWLPHTRVERARGCGHYTVLDDEHVRKSVLRFLRAPARLG